MELMGNPSDTPGTITILLQRVREGNGEAQNQLFELVDAELRRVARSMLYAKGLSPSVLRGTELVNAACERLLGRNELDAEDRAHFYFLVGRAMRHTIAEEARRASAIKRGGDRDREPLHDVPDSNASRALRESELNEGLDSLRKADPACADAIAHHYLGGRTLRQTAEVMGISLHTVRQHLAYGTAWLRARMESSESVNNDAHGAAQNAVVSSESISDR